MEEEITIVDQYGQPLRTITVRKPVGFFITKDGNALVKQTAA